MPKPARTISDIKLPMDRHTSQARYCGVVTGGTRGIGFAIARKLAENGHNLVLGYNSNDDAASEAKKALEEEFGVQVYTVKGDLAEEKTIETIFEVVETRFGGKLNAFVHNAGLYVGLTTQPESEQAKIAAKALNGEREGNFAQWDYYQNVYPKCFLRCVDKCVKYMAEDGGHIVAISTPGCNACQTPRLGSYITGQAKASMEFFVRYLALRLAERKINVNCVVPGYVDTDPWKMLRNMKRSGNPDPDDLALGRTPMKRWGQPNEVGDAVAFLCSSKAAFITGTNLYVDGGLHLR
ncbi:enoyl-[acyl-carrier-protein] reductase [NADPH] FabL-like [Ptychodera flava]|uniref:enoyl-[acyl-carrier-protein] reductase [NADPH] FabL-like n=1 Tax=Ptychodera flava TaxID=63121 RepID=UPI00396A2CB4